MDWFLYKAFLLYLSTQSTRPFIQALCDTVKYHKVLGVRDHGMQTGLNHQPFDQLITCSTS